MIKDFNFSQDKIGLLGDLNTGNFSFEDVVLDSTDTVTGAAIKVGNIYLAVLDGYSVNQVRGQKIYTSNTFNGCSLNDAFGIP